MHGLKPIVWIVWLGLVMIGVEVRHLHAKIVGQPAAALPLIFCGIAVVLVPLCLVRTTRLSRSTLIAFFAIGALLGVVGVYYHTKFQAEPFLQLFTAERSSGPQPLVPLSLTGLCMLGALAARLLPHETRAETSTRLSRQALDR